MDILVKIIFWIGLAVAIYALIKAYVIKPPRLTKVVATADRRLYRWIATDDVEKVVRVALNEGFVLKIIRRDTDWTTLHLTPREQYLLEENGITLAR